MSKSNMQIKSFLISILISTLLFSGCLQPNIDSKKNDNVEIAKGVFPFFTPDDKHIIYLKYSSIDHFHDEIHICYLDGSNDKIIANSYFDWTSQFISNNELIYDVTLTDTPRTINKINIDTGEITTLVEGSDFSLNKEKTKIVYVYHNYSVDYQIYDVSLRIYDISTQKIEEFNISGNPRSPILINNEYIIYFDLNTENLYKLNITNGLTELFLENIGDGMLNSGYELQLSPSGNEILFHKGDYELIEGSYLIEIDGNNERRIGDNCQFAHIHPKKEEIYYRGIEKVDYNGENQNVVIDAKYQWTFSFNSDASKIVYSARKIRDSSEYFIYISDNFN